MRQDNDDLNAFKGIMAACAMGLLVWALIITTCSAAAQSTVFDPAPLKDAKQWCYEHGPWCEPAAHAGVTLGFSAALDVTGIMDAEDARWIPVGFYVAKEAYDSAIRAPGQIPWHDTALDLAGVAVGWWLSDVLLGGDS